MDKILWYSTWKFNSGTVVALNSLGDNFNWKTIEKKITGLLAENKKDFLSTDEELFKSYSEIENRYVENLVISVEFINIEFDKKKYAKLKKCLIMVIHAQ